MKSLDISLRFSRNLREIRQRSRGISDTLLGFDPICAIVNPPRSEVSIAISRLSTLETLSSSLFATI
eukprot:468830-Amorphochlora_amoeboformis.AAC.2